MDRGTVDIDLDGNGVETDRTTRVRLVAGARATVAEVPDINLEAEVLAGIKLRWFEVHRQDALADEAVIEQVRNAERVLLDIRVGAKAGVVVVPESAKVQRQREERMFVRIQSGCVGDREYHIRPVAGVVITASINSLLKNKLLAATGTCRSENQTRKCLIFGARRGHAPRRSELKKARDGVFQQTVNAVTVVIGTAVALSVKPKRRKPRSEAAKALIAVVP